jgi:putative hemolysin
MIKLNPKINVAAMIGILTRNRMKNFRAHIPITIEKKNFVVKTADSREELHAALKLRHDVFLSELLKKSKRSGIDKDRFDKLCDHLIIIDKRTNMLIGTYRLQSSLFTSKWYTATEFHMKHIKRLPGTKLELGRACVHPEHRNGVTIALLWEGISAYIKASGTNYLFGCSSIKTTDHAQIREIYRYLLQNGHLSHEHRVRPRTKYKIRGMLKNMPDPETMTPSQMKAMIPSLLASYLKVGAKVCGSPALDKNFKCIDFLTLLDVSNLQEKAIRKPRDS